MEGTQASAAHPNHDLILFLEVQELLLLLLHLLLQVLHELHATRGQIRGMVHNTGMHSQLCAPDLAAPCLSAHLAARLPLCAPPERRLSV